MMEKVEKATLGLAPALLVYKENLEKAAIKGTILFYHGLSAAKETNLKELRSLADAGFLAVGLDNIGHGERRYSDFERRFSTMNRNSRNLHGGIHRLCRPPGRCTTQDGRSRARIPRLEMQWQRKPGK
ncbi:MAG: hypothetical protein HYU64_08710 [Armatimonadetes bacterium]|nr:hypothetical protein [Armatimonadota bacterium]